MPEVEQEEVRPGVTVVTSDTMPAFVASKLDKEEPEVKAETEKKEPEAKAEPEIKPDPEGEPKTEAEKKERKEGRLNKRFSEITGERDAERELRLAAEKERDELKAKLNPQERKQDDGKPKPEQFKDAYEYAEALSEWKTNEVLAKRDKEAAEKKIQAERELVVTTWRDRQETFKAATPDYADVISASEAKLSQEVTAAVMDSEVGPQLLYHFAQHPEEAERIGKLTVGGALRELGKLEAKLEGKAPTGASKSEQEKKPVAKVEISKAPAPISPLKGANAPADLPINSKGEWTGTYQQYKAAVEAGKIE